MPRFDFISLPHWTGGNRALVTQRRLSDPSPPPAITALLIAPRCSRRDAQAPRLMFNVATPRINACLRKTRHADCWIVPSDSWRKEVSHLSSIREGRMYYLVNWLRRGSKLGAFFSAELFKLSLMLIAGEGGQLVSLWLTLEIPWRL